MNTFSISLGLEKREGVASGLELVVKSSTEERVSFVLVRHSGPEGRKGGKAEKKEEELGEVHLEMLARVLAGVFALSGKGVGR